MASVQPQYAVVKTCDGVTVVTRGPDEVNPPLTRWHYNTSGHHQETHGTPPRNMLEGKQNNNGKPVESIHDR